MPPRKPYNPNTAYGRRKLREQAREEYEKMPPAQKMDANAKGCAMLFVILIIVFLIFWLMGKPDGFVKWMGK